MSTAKERHARARKNSRVVLYTEAGITGLGKNKTEAKADWLAKVKLALEGNWAPLRITVHGMTAIVWRDQTGWSYKILRDLEPGDQKEFLYGCGCGSIGRNATERAARAHLAQNLFVLNGRTGLSAIQNVEDMKEHIRWVEFQYCFVAWVQAGKTDDEAHGLAWPENWPEGVEPVDVGALPG